MKQELTTKTLPALMLTRREVFALIGGTAAASYFGCSGIQSRSNTPTIIAGCVVSPEQTEGPYFVDERLNRSDIRVDPSDGSVKPGVPLHLALTVFQIGSDSCNPLPGATVDIWHCDALGVYSDILDRTGLFADTRGQKFLRGYQVTDADGKVEFMTIYPGWYKGRTVHIHFMVRTEPESEVGHEFTSQLYFDDSITDAVHAQTPYSEKGQRDTRNDNDGIFRRGGNQLLLQLTKDGQGYLGTYNIGFLIT